MKSRKGFTLIELLAVIVILAIIALIATPIILGVIDTAKKGSAEASALAYVKAVEDQIIIGQVTGDEIKLPSGDASYVYVVGTDLNVEVKGTAPKADSSLTIDSKGEVTDACLIIEMDNSSSYTVKYDGKEANVVEGDAACTPGTSTVPSEEVTEPDVVPEG